MCKSEKLCERIWRFHGTIVSCVLFKTTNIAINLTLPTENSSTIYTKIKIRHFSITTDNWEGGKIFSCAL